MVLATEEDFKKKAAKLKEYLRHLDSNGRLTEKKLVSMLRSAIRQVWMHSPVKLAKLEKSRIADTDNNTRTKWLFNCNVCNKLFKEADIEVDHIFGNHEFTKLSDFEEFCEKILLVSLSQLQIICKECHGIKTWLESNGLDWRDDKDWHIGVCNKKTIEICKNKKDKYFLEEKGITPASNATKRKEQVLNYFLEDNEN